MKLTATYTAECCSFTVVASHEYSVVEALLEHITTKHKDRAKKLEKKAREMARSQNGCGYYDGSDDDTGWPNAQPTFRHAWRMNALKQWLRDGEYA